ncbi:MAG TPA: tetratricopeptide repeat protein, partial [Blastocatellia bacterium]|nr:tetratricopeptide repeat protein [Blastocatellia bacterium]
KTLEELKEQDATNRTRIISALGLGWYLKFNLSQQAEDKTRASTYCDQISGSHSADALIRCGVVLTGTRNSQAAISNFEAALRERPDDAEALLGLAEAYENAGDAAKAEQFYKQAISFRPEYWAGYNELGGFYFEQGRYKEAESCLLTVTDLLPLNPYAWTNLANTQLYQSKFENAQVSYNQSLQQQRTTDTYMNLGIALLYQNRCIEAADAFEQGTKLNASDAELWGLLGDAYRCAHDHRTESEAAYDKAIQLISERLKTSDAQASSYALLAEWLAKRGRNEQAIGHIAKALAVAPDEPFTQLSAVKVYYLMGRLDLALDFASKAAQNANSRFDLTYAPELAQLRAHPAYQSIANKLTEKADVHGGK